MTKTKEIPFGNGIDLSLAAEINFIIDKFKNLPDSEKRALAKTILDEDPDSEAYAAVGLKIFQTILDAEISEVANFMNNVFCEGEEVLDAWIVSGSHPAKAHAMTAHFRDHLVLNDSTCDVPMFDLKGVSTE